MASLPIVLDEFGPGPGILERRAPAGDSEHVSRTSQNSENHRSPGRQGAEGGRPLPGDER